MHWLKRLRILAAASLLLPAGAGAIGSFNPSAAELSLLPPYCGPRAQHWGNDLNRPEVQRWHSVFGSDYFHMHHYCQGMLLMLRGDSQPLYSQQARGEYKTALNNLEYMESRASSGFVLMPELYLKKGRVLLRLNQDYKALQAFRQAIALKRDYVPAYAALSDFYLDRGKPGPARKVLQEGLEIVPDASILQRRLAEISRDQDNETTQAEEGTPLASEPAAAEPAAASDGNAAE